MQSFFFPCPQQRAAFLPQSMADQYTTLDLDVALGSPTPLTLESIVATNGNFMHMSRLHSLLRNISVTYNPDDGVDALSNALLADAPAPHTFQRTFQTNLPYVLAANNLRRYFNTPAKIITCTEPTQLLLAVRCICDGIFESILNLAGTGSTDVAVKRELAQRVADAVYDQTPFANDGDSLEQHMAHVANYLQNGYKPTSALHVRAWDDQRVRCAVYAAYVPYFVFVFILSYVPLAGEPRPNTRTVTFLTTRRAKLCSYLFVLRMFVALHDRLPVSCSTPDCDLLRNFLPQVIDSVAFNIIDRENYVVDATEPDMQDKVRKLSFSNRETSEELIEQNKRYDMYRQNLTSAASSEMALQRQLNATKAWYRFNMWLWVALLVVLFVLLLLPRKMLGGYVGTVGYVLCGIATMYALIVALVGAVRSL